MAQDHIRAKTRFVAAACEVLAHVPDDKIVTFTCPCCGLSAVAVRLAGGQRRGVCTCGQKIFEGSGGK